MSFTHLQVRSAYSLMKSTIQIDNLIDKAKELNLDALALTDEQVLYGAVPFYKACVKNEIKPIIGMIVHLAKEYSQEEACILLAKNNTGYKELIKISTYLNQNEQPFLNWEELNINAENIIAVFPLADSLKDMLKTDDNDSLISYLNKRKQLFTDWYIGVNSQEMKQEAEMLHKLGRAHV